MDERSIDTCDRSAPDRAGAVQKDPFIVTDSFCYHSTRTRRCDVPGSLRHMVTNNYDWLVKRIDSRRFKHRMESTL
jgi:hypothetical protein